MAFWRVCNRAQRYQVAISGLFRGASAFLVGANPKLLRLDLRLMNLPGVYSLAINNAALIFEPNAFVALDRPRCFNFNILTNPRIMKLMSVQHSDSIVEGQRVCLFPNMLFYDESDRVTEEDFCAVDSPMPAWKNTFFIALSALFQLGFSNVYLIGCTFDIEQERPYAYEHALSENLIDYNKATYHHAVAVLKSLVPKIKDAGMNIFTCHEGTALEGIVDYVAYADAIGRSVRAAAPMKHNIIVHSSE